MIWKTTSFDISLVKVQCLKAGTRYDLEIKDTTKSQNRPKEAKFLSLKMLQGKYWTGSRWVLIVHPFHLSNINNCFNAFTHCIDALFPESSTMLTPCPIPLSPRSLKGVCIIVPLCILSHSLNENYRST